MKVYLSKSNLADPVIYSRVRAILSDMDCEIIEYKGTPDESEVIDSDIFLIVPPSTILRDVRPSFDESKQYFVGKGQAVYLESFLDCNAEMITESEVEHTVEEFHSGKCVLLVKQVGSEYVYVDELVSFLLPMVNWKDRYAELVGNNANINLNNYISPRRDPIADWERADKSVKTFTRTPENAPPGLFPKKELHLAVAKYLKLL